MRATVADRSCVANVLAPHHELARGLSSPPSTGELGADIGSLAMQVHDTRRRWKTLFPFFRP